MVCFCDILAGQASYHRGCYGDIAIVLTKEWGIANNISPIRYVHKNSIGQLSDYIKIKNINREINDSIVDSGNSPDLYQYARQHIFMGIAKDDNQLPYPSYTQSLAANSALQAYISDLDNEFEDFFNGLKTSEKNILHKYLVCLGLRLGEVYNELEKRDAFTRVYQDDFRGITDKILYDEREWRSIPDLTGIDKQVYIKANIDKYLPENYNLKFSSEDFVAVLVKEQQQVDILKDFISKNDTLLDKNKDVDKIMLYDNFNE
jgi:hypothetical protein